MDGKCFNTQTHQQSVSGGVHISSECSVSDLAAEVVAFALEPFIYDVSKFFDFIPLPPLSILAFTVDSQIYFWIILTQGPPVCGIHIWKPLEFVSSSNI